MELRDKQVPSSWWKTNNGTRKRNLLKLKNERKGGREGQKQVSRKDSREEMWRKPISEIMSDKRVQEGIRLFWYHTESQDTVLSLFATNPKWKWYSSEITMSGKQKSTQERQLELSTGLPTHLKKAFMPVILNNTLPDLHFQIPCLGFSHLQEWTVTSGLRGKRNKMESEHWKRQQKQSVLIMSQSKWLNWWTFSSKYWKTSTRRMEEMVKRTRAKAGKSWGLSGPTRTSHDHPNVRGYNKLLYQFLRSLSWWNRQE